MNIHIFKVQNEKGFRINLVDIVQITHHSDTPVVSNRTVRKRIFS